jgi:hypothetical protein
MPDSPAEREEQGKQRGSCHELVVAPHRVKIPRSVPGGVLDGGGEDAATGIEEVHAQ